MWEGKWPGDIFCWAWTALADLELAGFPWLETRSGMCWGNGLRTWIFCGRFLSHWNCSLCYNFVNYTLLTINKDMPTFPSSKAVCFPFNFLCTDAYSIMFTKYIISSRKPTGLIPKYSAASWYPCRAETRSRILKPVLCHNFFLLIVMRWKTSPFFFFWQEVLTETLSCGRVFHRWDFWSG